jgi:hypothetical protein
MNRSIIIEFFIPNRTSDLTNDEFLATLNKSSSIHMIPANVKGKRVMRFVANQENVNKEQIENAWKLIQDIATEFLKGKDHLDDNPHMPLNDLQRYSFIRLVPQDIYELHESQ